MAKSNKGAHGGGNKVDKPSKMPGVGFGDGFKKKGDALKDKAKPGDTTEPKGNKKKPGGAGVKGKH
jgi:hypothetical protein